MKPAPEPPVIKPPVILCVGRLYCDLIFTDLPRLPTMGTEVLAGGFGIHAGGGAVITAAHLTALGHDASLCAMLPTAPLGDGIIAEAERAGIDLGLCQPLAVGEDMQLTVALVGGGDRAFVTRRSGPPCPDIHSHDLRRLGVGHLHIGELATAIERPGLIALARDAGATVSLDCSWDDSLTAARIGSLIADVDIFLPNEAEEVHLSQIGVEQRFAPLTVIKRGAKGASARTKGQTYDAPAIAVPVVDTTGAGDAFNAGFIDAWLNGAGPLDCLRAGNAQGTVSVGRRGGFPAPSTDAETHSKRRAAR